MLCFNMGVALKKDGRARSKEERKFWVTVALRARYMPSLDQNVAGAGKQNKVHAQKTKNCTRISPRIFRAPCPIKTGGAQNGGGGGVGGEGAVAPSPPDRWPSARAKSAESARQIDSLEYPLLPVKR